MNKISEFNRFFLSKSLASTYKPTFLKCLLDLGDYKKDEGEKKKNKLFAKSLIQKGKNPDRSLQYSNKSWL